MRRARARVENPGAAVRTAAQPVPRVVAGPPPRAATGRVAAKERHPDRALRSPMDLILALLHTACYLLLAAALAWPRLGRIAAAALLGVALVSVLYGVFGPAERQLVTTHTFVAYAGNELEPGPVHFPTGTQRAPGWQWPLPFLGFAVLWAGVVWRRRGGKAPRNPFVLPIAFAWTATAAWLGMQWLAAPAEIVQPIGLERFLWPAGFALTLLLSWSSTQFRYVVLALSLGVVAQRLPAALFSKYASDHALGTSLDVSGIVNIVNPMTRLQFEPPLVAGSAEQQFWLIWAEHVFVFPAFFLLSFAGVAFAAFMIRKHHGMAD